MSSYPAFYHPEAFGLTSVINRKNPGMIMFGNMWVKPGAPVSLPNQQDALPRMFRLRKTRVSFWDRVLRWLIPEQDRQNLEICDKFREACSAAALKADRSGVDENIVVDSLITNSSDVRACPKLAVNVAMALRAKLGVDAMNRSTPGNVALVRSRIAKALGKHKDLRNADRAAHLALAEQVFFEDDTYHRTLDTRKRLAKRSWIYKLIIGESTAPQAVQF